jgi:hypothetical protein
MRRTSSTVCASAVGPTTSEIVGVTATVPASAVSDCGVGKIAGRFAAVAGCVSASIETSTALATPPRTTGA